MNMASWCPQTCGEPPIVNGFPPHPNNENELEAKFGITHADAVLLTQMDIMDAAVND